MIKFFYYWAYKYQLKVNSKTFPKFQAILVLGILQFFNIGTLTKIYFYAFNVKINLEKETNIIFGLLIALICFTINFFIFYINRNEIIKQFDQLTTIKQKRSKVYWRLYYILTIIIFLLTIIYIA